MPELKDITITVTDPEGLVLLQLSTADLRPTEAERKRDTEEFGEGFTSEPTPQDVADAVAEDIAKVCPSK